MKNLTQEQLEAEKHKLVKKAAEDKTMSELEETLANMALVREEFKRRGLVFNKTTGV